MTANEAAAQGADLSGLGGSLVSDEELAQLSTTVAAALSDEETAAAEAAVGSVGSLRPISSYEAVMTKVDVRAELEAAKSTQQVTKVFMTQAKQITGRDIPSEFRGSLQTAREHAEGLLRGLERFPEADLFKVESALLDKSAYAEAEGGVMRFNTAFTSDRQIYLRDLRRDVDSHWHPAGMDNPAGIALHEFGHILDIETLGEVARDDIEHLVEDSALGAGVSVEQIVKFDVSRYAFDGKELELAAEAFADVMLNGQAASQLSRDIYAELRKAYEAGGRTFTSTARVRAEATAEPRLTLTALRAQAREAGIRGFSRMSRDELEAALRPAATAVERAAMTPAEFDARAADAAKGDAAMEAAKVQAQIEAKGSDSATWKATGFSGVEGSVPNGTAAVTQYLRGPGFINDRLRFPDGRPIEPGWPVPTAEQAAKDAAKADKYVTALDKLMAQSPLETDAVVWRGLRLADIGLTDDVGVGFEWTDPGFVSTAGRRGIAENDFAQSGQAALVRILVPRGTGALGFEGLGESELLLDRNLTFRVVADNGRTEITSFSGKKLQGARLLDVEIVPKAAATTAETAAAQDLSRMTVAQLRAVAKDRGLTGYSKLTKPQLLERLAGEAKPVEQAVEAVTNKYDGWKVDLKAAMREEGVTPEQVSAVRAAMRSRAGLPLLLSSAEAADGYTGREILDVFAREHPGIYNRLAQEYRINDAWKNVYRDPGVTLADLKRQAGADFKRAIQDQPIVVRRANESRLRQAIEDGRLKTQFETGTSSGYLSPDFRAGYEQMAFSLPRDLPAEERPVYGFVSMGGVQPALGGTAVDMYGQIQLVLKDSVKDRTYTTMGDSLNMRDRARPVPLSNPDWTGADPYSPIIDNPQTFQLHDYVEAQILGGVSMSDVAEIVFPAQPEAATIEAMDAAGIPWRVLTP